MGLDTARVALADVSVTRHGHADGVETCVAGPATRSFPVHLSTSFGLCVKTGPAHDVVADGRRLTYPADAVCVRPPGCVWESGTGYHGFVSLDLPAHLVDHHDARLWTGTAMAFADHRSAAWALAAIRGVAGAESRLDLEQRTTDLVAVLAGDLGASVQDGAGAEGQVVARARDYLHDNLALRPTLEDTARAAGTDRFSLLRRFRSELGTTPHAYLVRARLARVQRLLARGLPVSEVAADCGFADQAHLGRWFRRVYGVTPVSYARQVHPAIAFQTDGLVRWEGVPHDDLSEGRPVPSHRGQVHRARG